MSNLQKIDFRQRQNLPNLEEKVLEHWDSIQAFERSVSERPDNKPYVFYDGPPFVTGSPHYGSILGSIAKDVVPRYWTMKGYKVERQWGWDCHGLPIENMIEKELGISGRRQIEEMGIDTFNNACRAAIQEIDATWDVIIRRIGRWVDFKNSYKTMDKSYMESVWWAFKELYEKQRVYQGRKVILYCPRCGTPLSNFEIAMDNSYEDVTDEGSTYQFAVDDNTYLLAWSTTPWTKIGTMALAVHPDLVYVVAQQGAEQYIVAKSRVEAVLEGEYTVVDELTGTELSQRYDHYTPHFDWWTPAENETKDQAYRIVTDTFVTDDAGTGAVTLAVYGEDDFRVMQDHDIPLYDYVTEEGKLDSTIQNDDWQAKFIWKISPAIDDELESRGLIYKREKYTHSIPVCYRCSTRLYYAPLPAWFIDVQNLKDELLEQNEKINWYPEHLKHGRFAKGIQSAPDWNISRSRYWGTPMPVWTDASGEHMRIIGSVAELQEWAVNPEEAENLTDIHREFVDDIAIWLDDERTIQGKRIPEVFDVWVESGSMPYASRHYPFENEEKFRAAYPAEFVSEYINQTRAWFYTMHVLSVGIFGQPAVTNIHNTGVILAADGSKMSKSKKNYSDPMTVLDQSGADALRLYLMSSPVAKAENLAFKDEDVDMVRKRILNIWWNVFSFYQLYKPATWQPAMPQSGDIMDQWILALLESTKREMTEAMDNYDITTAGRLIIEFVDELSTWYLRQSRERLRDDENADSWNTFHYVLKQFAIIAAPIVPFITEAMYLHLEPELDSVHLELWPAVNENFLNAVLLEEMASVRKPVEQGHAARRDSGIKVRQPLASISIVSSSQQPRPEILAVVEQELNIKRVEWTQTEGADLSDTLDTVLTPELEAEGEARELIRAIQRLRKEHNVDLDASIIVTAPSWPVDFEEEIKEKTKAIRIETGAELTIALAG